MLLYAVSFLSRMPFHPSLWENHTSSKNLFIYFFWPHGMREPSSLTWDQTPGLGAWNLSHWTTREVPILILKWQNVVTFSGTYSSTSIFTQVFQFRLQTLVQLLVYYLPKLFLGENRFLEKLKQREQIFIEKKVKHILKFRARLIVAEDVPWKSHCSFDLERPRLSQ